MYNTIMTDIPYQHLPVMPDEVVEFLRPAAGKVIVDCTLGGGGHAQALLGKSETINPDLKIIGFDQDEDAIRAARERLNKYKNIEYIHDNFSHLSDHIKQKVDGFLFDLGISSYQIDSPGRGFSLQNDGPLDMRMDRRQKLTAADIVNHYPADDLASLFYEYGQERFAKRISHAIDDKRYTKRIESTFELKGIVEGAIPTWKKRESVTRIFQALRIAVNSELAALSAALSAAIALLGPGGRIVVLSYHSLEDRQVKRAFRAAEKDAILRIMTKKPLAASAREIESNPRARSAKLRAAERA